MNTILILLLQSATSAMIEIALLLVGAGLICFLSAFYYQKSVFTPIIKKLEAEKEDLNKKIVGLNNDISGLKAKIGELENTIAAKDKEIEQLKKVKKEAK
jgi:peptidoglycan hydrolase CwlO-like protein